MRGEGGSGYQERGQYLTEEGDGLLIQGLGVSDIATDHTLEGEGTSVSKFLNEQE